MVEKVCVDCNDVLMDNLRDGRLGGGMKSCWRQKKIVTDQEILLVGDSV